jgi:GT2 family glycosyltransferase
MAGDPAASVVIPTRARPGYLDVTLGSVMPQARELGAEVLVVCDGPDPATAAVAQAHGARLLTLPEPRGLNAARNGGAAAASANALVIFIDDDICAPAGWLQALIAGADADPGAGVFGGPIRARLESGGPRACGREPAPITTLDLGPTDRDAQFVWGANLAIRRSALELTGPFDETISGGRGDEEEWLRRFAAHGGRIRYLAAAGLEHRRTAQDSTVRALSRAAYALGHAARRNDARKGTTPTLRHELRVLGGCAWHSVRRRCAYGIVMGAHSAGRVRETLSPTPIQATEDFLSGTSGLVTGLRATASALARDALADARSLGGRARLARAAASGPVRRVLVLSVERPEVENLLIDARTELAASRHHVSYAATTTASGLGKFENLGKLLAEHPTDGYDWLLVLDDDVRLPRGFLDRFLFLAERFSFQIAQPAHRFRSHAGWPVTRRVPGSVARETAFVEIGPVTAFAAASFGALLPFPPLRAGWGLDLHWSAIASRHDWRIGVIDATPIAHILRPVAASYDRSAAVDEARSFLAGRPYTPAAEAGRTLVVHHRW